MARRLCLLNSGLIHQHLNEKRFFERGHLLLASRRLFSVSLSKSFGQSPYKQYSFLTKKDKGTETERIIIVGSGWAGFKFLENVDKRNLDIVVVSPRNYFLFTPLLASTCVGTLEFRSIVEPIRRQGKILPGQTLPSLRYYESSVESIDLLTKRVECVSVLDDKIERFSLGYDKLILACGSVPNTFNIPGVTEHACFLKDINDARKIRYRIMECFEKASQPGISEERRMQLLHFVVVGGGPTGVEFLAELHDLINEDLSNTYAHLMKKVNLVLIDVAPKILSTFDISLSDYTAQKFARKGIIIRTGTSVIGVEPGMLLIKDGSKLPFGLLVWATGLAQNDLLKNMTGISKEPRSGRIFTDHFFRMLDNSPTPSAIPDTFAIGDCATIKNYDLPCTAQVAKQKAKYLARVINRETYMYPLEDNKPFSYRDMGSMAYVGEWRAIAGLSLTKTRKWNESGFIAWLLWRSAYFTMSISWRNKILIPIYWFLASVFGRDISHIK